MSISLIKADKYKAPPGQAEWTSNSGSFSWIVPRGVFAISAVCIGGGGGGASSTTAPSTGGSGGDLIYGNVMSVTPGEILTIVVGGGGSGGQATGQTGGAGGESYILQNGVRMLSAPGGGGGVIGVSATSGKNGTYSWGVTTNSWYNIVGRFSADVGFGGFSTTTSATSSERSSGGGGAGGYGNGGSNLGSNGVNNTGTSTAETTGGGSGGVGSISGPSGGGGGTGPWGQGSNSTAATGARQSGVGGSSGLPSASYLSILVRIPNQWAAGGNGCHGGLFGGGGGGGCSGNPGTAAGFGARGCVRIIWGDGRQFPSYGAGNVDTTDTSVATSQQSYTTAGSYSWVVPAGIYNFSAVCIGGGGPGLQSNSTTGKTGGGGAGLCWAGFECVPGETFTVVAGAAGASTGVNLWTNGGTSSITRNVSFKGFISGTSLHITEVTSGRITTGLTITGSGVTSTTINAFQTGEYGKVGTYTVGTSQTVGSITSPITITGTQLLMSATGGTNSGTAASASSGGTASVPGTNLGSASYSGGTGGQGTTATTGRGQGGGGAAGYGGNGANASNTSGSAANGAYPATGGLTAFPGSGASGANSGATALGVGAGGGGVGLFGWGKDPNIDNFTNTAGPTVTAQGFGGSGGTDGSAPNSTGTGGTYGGGGGGAGSYTAGRSNGGPGAVRITWGRATYPGPTVDV
jgi:hypothetical protein